MSANTVAIVSVIVTGLASPLIAGVVASARARSEQRHVERREHLSVLDEAGSQLVRAQMAFTAATFGWRTGRDPASDAVAEAIRRFHAERESAWVMYNRLATRFGVEHPVALTFHHGVAFLRSLRELMFEYEGSTGRASASVLQRIDDASARYISLERDFLTAAYETARGRATAPEARPDPHPAALTSGT